MLKEILLIIAKLLNCFNFETLSTKSRHQVQYELKEAQKEQIEVISIPNVNLPSNTIKKDSVKKDIPTSFPKVEFKDKPIEIIDMLLPLSETMGKRKYTPTQVLIHHSGGSSLLGMYKWFETQPIKVATNYAIDTSGKIYRFMQDNIWAYSLGIRFKSNDVNPKYKTKEHSDKIEQLGIGIELVNEGEVELKGGKFWFETGKRFVDKDSVITLDKEYKGYKHFVKYTDEQIVSLIKLIDYLCNKYEIKKEWEGTYEVSEKALQGYSGIYSHVNFRKTGKTDLYPYPKLEAALKNLK